MLKAAHAGILDHQGRHEKALAVMREAAAAGVVEGELGLGLLYEKGRGLDANLSAAAAWYRRAAERGSRAAQLGLAMLHENGDGVPYDVDEAVTWARRAAGQGLGWAHNWLGDFYRYHDPGEALDWYREALGSDDSNVRSAAVSGLADIGTPDVVPILADVLAWDESPTLRGQAAKALGRLEGPAATAAADVLVDALYWEGSAPYWEDDIALVFAVDAVDRLSEEGYVVRVPLQLIDRLVSDGRWEAISRLPWNIVPSPSQSEADFLAAALDDPNPRVRAAAIVALQRLQGDDALSVLANALAQDDEPLVRSVAAGRLAALSGSSALPALRTALKEDTVGRVRRSAAEALGELGEQDALPELAVAMLDDPNSSVRLAAFDAMARLGRMGVGAALLRPAVEALQYGDRKLRERVIALFPEMPAREVIPALSAILDRHADEDVRKLSADALSRLGADEAQAVLAGKADGSLGEHGTEALRTLGPDASVRALADALSSSSDAEVRLDAAQAMRVARDLSAALPALAAALSEDEDEGVRHVVALALAEHGSDQALAVLREALAQHGNPEVRRVVAHALGYASVAHSVPALAAALATDPDPDVRAASASALGQIGGERSASALSAALKDEDAEVREAALDSLLEGSWELQDLAAEQKVLSVLGSVLASHEDNDVRRRAAQRIGVTGLAEGVPALGSALVGDTETVRVAAAAALGMLRVPQALDLLTRALVDDPATGVRTSAAKALGGYRTSDAVTALAVALETDRADEVRTSAADALGHVRHPDAVPALLTALADPVPLVRNVAVASLVELGAREAVPSLIPLADDPSPGVRRQVGQSLADLIGVEAASALVRQLKDPSAFVRRDAARALVQVGGLSVLSPSRVLESAQELAPAVEGVQAYSKPLLALMHYGTEDRPRGEVLELLGGLLRAEINAGTLTEAGLEADLAAIRAELGEEVRPEDNPYVSLFLARLFSEGGQHSAALSWSARALERLDPDEVAPAVVLRGIRAWSLAESGRLREGLAELERAERELLPWVTTFERERLDRPLAAWVLFLKGQLLARAGELEAAQRVLEAAKERARREPGPSEEARERVLKWVQAELAGVYIRRVGPGGGAGQ